jgi:signal transduction histidine kinase
VNTNHSLREAQEALKAAQEQLIEAEKLQSVGRLAAGVAHEVKNPLAIMEMGIAFLANQQNSPNSALILGELEQAVKRADDVISSLMKLSTPEEMGMQAVEMDALLDRALSALETEISAAGIKVITHYAADAPQCRVDVAKIEQAFHNVLANAIQAMPQGGTLTLETSPRMLSAGDVGYDAGDRTGVRFREGENALVVEVRDTGPGIPPESVGKVFEPFFTTKPTGKGMGLGLTVAKKLIDLHAGRITIRNVDAGGVGVTMMFKTI